MIRVVVADDQDIVRDGLVTVLGLIDDIEVVADAADGRAAVEVVDQLVPDAVLMDLRMPGLDGAAATKAIVTAHPDVAVLVLTTFADDDSIAGALSAGARGYLTKDAGRDDIAAALRAVVLGQTTLDPRVSGRLLAGLRTSSGPGGESGGPSGAGRPGDPAGRGEAGQPGDPALSVLTRREREVLGLIGAGLNNSEIAERMFVSTATVKTHINNLFAKLGIRDRAQAVRIAAGHGGHRSA